MSRKMKILTFSGRWGLTVVVAGIILIPLYWIFISSLTPAAELFKSPIDYLPDHATLANYKSLIFKLGIGQKALDTLIITGGSLIVSTIACLLAAYAFTRFKSGWLSAAFGAIIFSALIPGIVTARPLFDFLKSMNLIDTYLGLTILYTSNLIPFTVLIMVNFLGAIPLDFEEAANVDGANFIQKLFKVTLPLMGPAIATTLIINFITCLNDLFTPLFFSQKIEVLSIGITTIPKLNSYMMPWDLISTMGWIILLPIIIFILIFEKRIMEGIMAGGVKG
ncbi:carbohydrate ABC transporter permease [Cohnella sp. 56]|uniref:carbohydrate ABC transporter permease n=1 Tax=Cohnella sp. 56 TaxID=3113722 RepID=UPI0030EB0F79